MEIRYLGHTAYKTKYHIVWASKYRLKILEAQMRKYLRKLFRRIVKKMPGIEMVKMKVQTDHVHLVVIIPPKYAVSTVMGRIKGHSASRLCKRYDWLHDVYRKKNCVWAPGYFVSTIGADEDTILEYVRSQ